MAGQPKSLAERFAAKWKVGPPPEIDPDLGPCHIWTGSFYKKGYGYISRGRRDEGKVLAHRLAWELEEGEIPPGKQIDHRCMVRACVRRSHLRLATNKENNEHRRGPNKTSDGSRRLSQYRNVTWHAAMGKWMVQVGHMRRNNFGGYFEDEGEANEAAIALRARLHTRSDGR